MDTLLQRRRSNSIGATQAQPREACIVVHYGPYHELVAEQHSLFKVAGELLTRVTPWLRYVEPIASDGVVQLPDVELPRDVVQSFFALDDDGEEAHSASNSNSSSRGRTAAGAAPHTNGSAGGPSLKFSRRTLAGSPDVEDALANVNRRGRPVLSLTSAALGELQVTSWSQWESVQEMLLQEERNKYRTHYYELSSGQPPSSYLLVHAELTILWFEVDTLHCLHYDDLVNAYAPELSPDECDEEEWEEEENEEEEDDEDEDDADVEVDIPLEAERIAQSGCAPPVPVDSASASSARAAAAPPSHHAWSHAHPQDDARAADEQRALLDSAAAAAVRASMEAPSLIARLYVVDIDGAHRGQVLLPLALDPPVTLAELAELVRAAASLRRHHHALRLSYRVLPPSSLALSTSRTPSRPGSARLGGGGGSSSTPAAGAAPSTPRELGISVTSTMSRYSQQPGVLGRSILKPLSDEGDVTALIDDVLLYGYRAIRLVAVETERVASVPPSPPSLARAAAETPVVHRPMPPPHRGESAGEVAVLAPATAALAPRRPSANHDRDAQARAAHAKTEDAAEEVEEEGAEEEEEEEEDDALVVVRYTIDPVEVHVTGEVEEAQLVWLAEAIYTRCCRPDNYRPTETAKNELIARGGGVISQRIRMRPRFLRTFESPQSSPTRAGNGQPVAALEPAHWVLPLHDYAFSEADEDVMGLCIQEAMINSGQMTAIAPEEIQDLVDDLERERDERRY